MKYSTLRLISGALLIIAVLIADSLTQKFLITAILIVLAILSGKKFKILPNLILLVSLSLAHTLQPNGLVLITIGQFPITLGAMIIGAKKALLLISFIYASHYMMSSRPQIPGKLGNLLSLQFYYFEKLTSAWDVIEHKRPIIKAIDQLLFSIERNSTITPIEKREERMVEKKDVIIQSMHILVIYSLIILLSEPMKEILPFIALLP